MNNRLLGGSGEDRAVAWYQSHGYKILDRNWRSGRLGEIDVVAVRGRELVISEVKARSSDRFGLPAEAITPAKQQRLRRLGASYIQAHPLTRFGNVRFDIVSIVGSDLEVLEGAF